MDNHAFVPMDGNPSVCEKCGHRKPNPIHTIPPRVHVSVENHIPDEPRRTEILKEADNIINGDRLDSYGPPEVSFGRIAALLNAMGYQHQDWRGDRRGLDSVDVALILVQVKQSRLATTRDHRDSWVDTAGYAGLGGELALDKKEMSQKGNDEDPVQRAANGMLLDGPDVVFNLINDDNGDTACELDNMRVHHSKILKHMADYHMNSAAYTVRQ